MGAEEDEETKSSCRITKTILHVDPFIQDYIYKLVTAAPELEARGNLIFTYALFRYNEQEAVIPTKRFSQSFMTACIRTAGLRQDSKYKPVGYDPYAVCLHYMTEANGAPAIFHGRKTVPRLTLWWRSFYRRNPVSAKYHTRNSRHSNRYGSVNPKHD
jgi:hypothetical protein